MFSSPDVGISAKALVDRYGPAAVEYARAHAEELGRSGDLRGQDLAWRVLSAVELMISGHKRVTR